ncbi:MAG: hypothetical protein IT365_23815, partial [Candidatus Hydrogenedentes bacterium]|nr:hypothetical protein [Candidatus Hydrogenedentota bacterium]
MSRKKHVTPGSWHNRSIPALADMGQQGPPPLQQPRMGQPMRHGPQKSSNTCLIVALVSIVVGVVAVLVIGILAAILIPAIMRARDAAQRASCQGNLKQSASVFLMWANEHDGILPPLASTQGEFRAADDTIYPKYMYDLKPLVCPSDPDGPGEDSAISGVTDDSYFYLGYMMTNETEARAFIEAYKARAAEGGGFEEDLQVEPGKGTGGSDRIVRLHSDPLAALTGVGDATVPDASEVPIMFDRSPTHHMP